MQRLSKTKERLLRDIEDEKELEKLYSLIDFWFGYGVRPKNDYFTIRDNVYKVFMIKDEAFDNDVWAEDIKNILMKYITGDMYLVDWNHSIEVFNLKQYDSGFYPDGDDYFFISQDFSKALLCIAGFGDTYSLMYVVGQELVDDFTKNQERLLLLDYDKKMMLRRPKRSK